jgi:putative endonuclease
MKNPHHGSPLSDAFSELEWKEIQRVVAERLAKSWYVYIIQSTINDRLYTGVTNRLEARVKAHNDGKGAKATRAGRPWKLVLSLPRASKGEALKAEAAIKRLSRREKLKLIKIGAMTLL